MYNPQQLKCIFDSISKSHCKQAIENFKNLITTLDDIVELHDSTFTDEEYGIVREQISNGSVYEVISFLEKKLGLEE